MSGPEVTAPAMTREITEDEVIAYRKPVWST